MAAPSLPLYLPLLAVLAVLPSRPAAADASADCAVPPPALLLASQVTELARTALTADSSRQDRHSGGAAPLVSSVGSLDGPTPPTDPPPSSSPGAVLDRLEALERSVQQLSAVVSRLGSGGTEHPAEKPEVGDAALPGTCLQLQRSNGSLPDGVYQLSALAEPVYCDFSHDGGGWTLLLTAATRDGWDRLNVRLRNPDRPSLTDNYSILGRGDALKALGAGDRFAYRLEAQAEVNRRQWGGVWLAPRGYTLTPETDTQRDIALVKKFNKWTYGKPALQRTMPWINVEDYLDGMPLLTATLKSSRDWWGTLLTDPATTNYQHSPWISAGAPQSGTVLYWLREEVLP